MLTREQVANLEPGRLVALHDVAINVPSALSRHNSYTNEEWMERLDAGWSYTVEAGSVVLMVFAGDPDPDEPNSGLCMYASHTFLDVPLDLVMEHGVIQEKIVRT